MADNSFKEQVYLLVSYIPRGRVMSYGQIAALCGRPRAARAVGGIAHFGPDKLPWHRVVNKQGGLASGFWGGKELHKKMLMDEGVAVKNYEVNIDKLIWWPNE